MSEGLTVSWSEPPMGQAESERVKKWLESEAQSSMVSDDTEDVRLRIGEMMPPWFWRSVAADRIRVTGAKFGDYPWGAQGVEVLTAEGWVHVDVGGVVRKSDLLTP